MTFKTVPQLLAAAVERYPDAAALITREDSESFAELGAAVASAAEALTDRGLQPGDQVLIVAPNSIALIHVWLGAITAGVIPAAVNPESTASELEYFQEDLKPRLIIKEQDVASFHSSPFPSLPTRGREWLRHPVDALTTAAIVYTSGTTSRPKGVMVRHAAYTESGDSFPDWIGLRGPQRLWACLPFFHINAQAYSLMGALAHGHSLAISKKFHASTFWEEARALQVTSVNVVGAMLDFVAKQPESRWVESPLRTIYSAPGPMPEQRRELEDRFRVRIVTGYGMSENPFGCAESTTSRDKPGSIGRPRQPSSLAFENRLRIVRPDGTEAKSGEVGELAFQNLVMTPGYWNAPDISQKTLVDGWLHTGDAGYADDDGDVFLSGRYKEMIRRRGENIAPAEIEDVLLAHDAVESAAVFGIDAGLQEEEVIAAVVLKRGEEADESTLKAFAATRVAAFKVPSRIYFRESLPMTATHRVAKDALRKEYGRG